MYFYTLNRKKITKPGIPNGFLEILKENRSFFAKNGPKIFNSRYLKNTFFRTSFFSVGATNMKFGQVIEKNGPKKF